MSSVCCLHARASGSQVTCQACRNSNTTETRVVELKARLRPGKVEKTEDPAIINELNDPLHKLPREIISRIFECEYALDAYEEPSKSPFVLGAVCRFWRAVAWSTPAIWTHVSFCINPSGLEDDLPSRIKLLGPYFDRSGALPLSIRVHIAERFQFIQYDFDIKRLIEVLHGCMERWHALSLQLPVAFLPYFSMQLPPLGPPKLKSMSLSTVEKPYSQVYLDLTKISRNLQRLCLKDTALTLDSVKVSHTHLTHVAVFGSVASWMSLFCTSPLLQEADFFEEIAEYKASTFEPADIIKHESLKSVKVTFQHSSSNLDTLLQFAALPNLHDLLLDTIGRHSAVLLPFLGRIRALKVLELWNLEWSSDQFEEVLPELPQLEELSIHQLHKMSATELFSAIFHLRQDSSDSNGQKTSPLPNLVSFHYGGYWIKNDHWSFLCHLGNCHCAIRTNTALLSSPESLPVMTRTWPKLRKISAEVAHLSSTEVVKAVLDEELLEVAQRLRDEGIEISLSLRGISSRTDDLVEESAKELRRINLKAA